MYGLGGAPTVRDGRNDPVGPCDRVAAGEHPRPRCRSSLLVYADQTPIVCLQPGYRRSEPRVRLVAKRQDDGFDR